MLFTPFFEGVLFRHNNSVGRPYYKLVVVDFTTSLMKVHPEISWNPSRMLAVVRLAVDLELAVDNVIHSVIGYHLVNSVHIYSETVQNLFHASHMYACTWI